MIFTCALTSGFRAIAEKAHFEIDPSVDFDASIESLARRYLEVAIEDGLVFSMSHGMLPIRFRNGVEARAIIYCDACDDRDGTPLRGYVVQLCTVEEGEAIHRAEGNLPVLAAGGTA